jgi:hypothetical protein
LVVTAREYPKSQPSVNISAFSMKVTEGKKNLLYYPLGNGKGVPVALIG